ncbi:ABC transporter ATP-binding protein [Nitrospina gracilis]|uniref:ABC transporter ATP-binding protein n=1 Tax=Nitrospina gracilis TaxID=35801 RepID=UPI001F199643|nr:ABC transporter ATP-binding protein [Nitrospina gracilis]MCF8721049.1 ATP-binding cassette subfamily B protein [Nitrospina gracilis Nb-211]
MEHVRTFIRYMKPHRREIGVGIIALLVTDLVGMVIPWLLKQVIDLLPNDPAQSQLIEYAGWLFLAAGVQAVARYGWRRHLFGPSRKMEIDILNHVFAHFLTLDRTFFQKHEVGDLMSRATNDLRAVKDFLGLGLLVVLDAVVVIIGCLALMIYINPKLTLYALLPLPIISVLFFTFIRAISIRHQSIQENLSRITSMVQENLAGIRVLHAFVQEQNEIRRFDRLNRDHIDKNMSLAKMFGLFTPSLVFVIGIAAMITLWIGGKEVIDGSITLGSFVAFNGYLMMLSWPMMAIGYVINLWQKGVTAMRRIQHILNSRSALAMPEKEVESFDIRGGIEVRNLTFSYPDSEAQALDGIDLHIEAGTSVAFIGMIGAGKSTLMQLLPRVYDAPQGRILLDGKPLSEIPTAVLRRHIGYVEQEPFLFSTTIRNNIALARPEATDAEIDAVVRCVHLTPDLERFPQGLDTVVGERGVSVSGGQKQRIALARALIRKPRILILDDAFSSLDVETESIILNNIRSVIQGTTTLIVTHRLSLARQVDRVVVLSEGKVLEEGGHAQLMQKQDGVYRHIYNNQALAREMEILLQ